jgi:hypothetical protein
MCGPFVISQTKGLRKITGAAILPYHLGRITTYTVMAVLLATLLNAAFLFLPIRSYIVAPILMTAGLIFFVTAFPSLSKIFPWTARLSVGAPYKFIQSGYQQLAKKDSMAGRFGLGVLLGFMPCGVIVSALMAASTAPSAWQAGLAMIAFGVGTMPALISIALGGQLLQKRYPNFMKRITQGAMVWSGVWLFLIAGFLLI